MRTRHRALTAIVIASLFASPLAACTTKGDDATTSTTQTASPTVDPADATPQERAEAYLKASDASAAAGWEDSSYADEYLTPELAERQKQDDAGRAESGATISGERILSDWMVVEETDTTSTVEFCEDSSNVKATKDGRPYEISNALGEFVGQHKLIRSSASEPWMIEQKGYYEQGTTCAAHFAG